MTMPTLPASSSPIAAGRPALARWSLPAIALLALLATSSRADVLADWLKLDGFGTIGTYMADDPVALARVDGRQSSGSRDGQWRYDGDTQLSLQATVNPTGRLRGVVQLLAKKNYQGSMRPQLEWGYAAWQASPALGFKLGRTILPTYLQSDYRNLLYAQTWARPTTLFYTHNAVTYQDGLSLQYESDAAGGEFGLEAFAGRSEVRTQNKDGVNLVKLPQLGGLLLRWSDEHWLLRAGYSRYRIDVILPSPSQRSLDQLIALPASQCDNCREVLQRRYRQHDIDTGLLTLAATAKLGASSLQAEWQLRRANSSFVNNVDAWYVLASHRINRFTPYLAWGRSYIREGNLGLHAGPAASTALKSQLAFIDGLGLIGNGERRQLDMGLRWDFHEAMALKAQWSRMDITHRDIGSGQTVVFPIPSSRFDGRVNLYSLNLDFVF